MGGKVTRISVAILIAFATSSAHAAFEFGPIISNVAPSGPGATTSYTVSNTGENKIPVQVSIVAREPDESGKEVYSETEAVSDMFRIFPAQLVLNPKETRTVRVTYVGTPKLKSEMAFRVIAEELPVDMSDPKKVYKKAVANVTIAVKYVGSLYVTPAGAKSSLQLEAVPAAKTAGTKDQAKQELSLTITNTGTAHEVVRKPALTLESGVDKSVVVLTANDLATMTNLNILAGKKRKFTLQWPAKLPVGPVKASLEAAKE